MNRRNKTHHFKAAFTLMEMLVVITIIAVLATLLFALTSSMRKKASSATSVSNLRQIGAAIVSYASDYNSTLPGPVLSDHSPLYQNNSNAGWLGWLLKDYLSSVPQPNSPKPRVFYTSALDYPSAKSGAKTAGANWKPTYVVVAKQTDAITGAAFWPMGNYTGTQQPMTTAQLSARETRGKPWITEIDQIIRPNKLAEEQPPHGKFRNTLMFDYSVKAIPLGDSVW